MKKNYAGLFIVSALFMSTNSGHLFAADNNIYVDQPLNYSGTKSLAITQSGWNNQIGNASTRTEIGANTQGSITQTGVANTIKNITDKSNQSNVNIGQNGYNNQITDLMVDFAINVVSINQKGTKNLSSMKYTNSYGMNTESILQDGYNNSASLVIDQAYRNSGSITQSGTQNTASLVQSGSRSGASIDQSGYKQSATISQSGGFNILNVKQH